MLDAGLGALTGAEQKAGALAASRFGAQPSLPTAEEVDSLV